MPRSLTAATLAAISAVYTKPVYFLELGFTPALRFSSRGTVVWKTFTWFGSGLQVTDLSFDNGIAVGSVSLFNQDQSLSAYVLGQGTHDLSASLWVADADALDTTDPVLLIDGYIDGATFDADRCAIGLVASTMLMSFAPRQVCAPPLFNHLPPRGTIVSWGSDTYILNGR